MVITLLSQSPYNRHRDCDVFVLSLLFLLFKGANPLNTFNLSQYQTYCHRVYVMSTVCHRICGVLSTVPVVTLLCQRSFTVSVSCCQRSVTLSVSCCQHTLLSPCLVVSGLSPYLSVLTDVCHRVCAV